MEEWHGILVVDDEADVAARFRRRARQGTYVLHFVGSADEALELPADAIEPTLIAVVPEINMPGMDGLELLREVKQRWPDLPVMMVTTYGDRRANRSCRIPYQAGRLCPVEGRSSASCPTPRIGASGGSRARLRPMRQASALKIKRRSVSKIEKQPDMHLSTLRNYVEAVGGELELVVKLPQRSVLRLHQIGDALGQPARSRRRSPRPRRRQAVSS